MRSEPPINPTRGCITVVKGHQALHEAQGERCGKEGQSLGPSQPTSSKPPEHQRQTTTHESANPMNMKRGREVLVWTIFLVKGPGPKRQATCYNWWEGKPPGTVNVFLLVFPIVHGFLRHTGTMNLFNHDFFAPGPFACLAGASVLRRDGGKALPGLAGAPVQPREWSREPGGWELSWVAGSGFLGGFQSSPHLSGF